jgi:lysophospholipase L1-like esterase
VPDLQRERFAEFTHPNAEGYQLRARRLAAVIE